MGLVIVHASQSSQLAVATAARLRRTPPPCARSLRCQVTVHRGLGPSGTANSRFNNFVSQCSVTNVEVDINHAVTEEIASEDIHSSQSGHSFPIVTLTSDILNNKPLNLLTQEADSLVRAWPVLSDEEQEVLEATPAHPAGLYALYASCLAGNLVEQLWNFAWPAAVAIVHPSLLPVAVVGFFMKLAIFIGGPLVGNLMDSFPRIPSYYSLNVVQTAAQLLSAAMIIFALRRVHHISAASAIFQPWFVVLVIAGAVERLAGLALGVTMERDWVVLLAGSNRPVALAQANAMLNRIDLLCEIAGASMFGILLSKYDPVTCLKLASGLMIFTLPVLIVMGYVINSLSSGVLDHSRFCQNVDKSSRDGSSIDMWKIVESGLATIRHGWMEYKNQPVLPASAAYVLLCFNIALAPGSIMTAFLTHHGINPSIIGSFSGLCAFMGVAATFLSASLVRKLGVLKAGAAGLIFQASLLVAAVAVFLTRSITKQTSLLFFLSLIVLSRLGHMSYDVVGTQILQTGIPVNKANLIGTTEVSIASLAELLMLGVVIVANDVSHFGFLAMLSVSSVIAAAWMYCCWLSNPTDKQTKLFSFDPHSSYDGAAVTLDGGWS